MRQICKPDAGTSVVDPSPSRFPWILEQRQEDPRPTFELRNETKSFILAARSTAAAKSHFFSAVPSDISLSNATSSEIVVSFNSPLCSTKSNDQTQWPIVPRWRTVRAISIATSSQQCFSLVIVRRPRKHDPSMIFWSVDFAEDGTTERSLDVLEFRR